MLKIIEYTEAWKEKWDNFVLASSNGTMFHLQKFFDYHKPGKFKFNHLIFLDDKDNIEAVLPGTIKNKLYESPVGASYGSIVTKDLKFDKALEIVTTLEEYAKGIGINEIMLTSAPMIYEKYPNQNLDFALLWKGFNYSLHYISSAIKLDKETDILSRFAPTVRRNVRKSYKEKVTVEISDRFDLFYPILIDNKARHNVKPTHSLEDLYRLDELLPGYLKLFLVKHDGNPIAGSLMFFANTMVAICFYNMLYYDYQYLKPIQRVMYEVVKYSTEHNYAYVDIGVSQDTSAENPMTPSINLINFKEQFDAKTIMRNTLYKKLG